MISALTTDHAVSEVLLLQMATDSLEAHPSKKYPSRIGEKHVIISRTPEELRSPRVLLSKGKSDLKATVTSYRPRREEQI